MELNTTYLTEQENKKARKDTMKFVAYVVLTIATGGGLRLLVGEGADCFVLLVAAIPWGIAMARRLRL